MRIVTTALVLACIAPSFGQSTEAIHASETPSVAPLNPNMLEYGQAVAANVVMSTTAEGFGLGWRPAPVDLSHIKGQQVILQRAADLPTSYDLRSVPNKLPPIRNQGSCGACWAFATYGALESALRPAETAWNFSEMDLNCHHGFDWLSCEGGNQFLSTAFLARQDGPVNESCYPYAPPNCASQRPNCARQKRVQEVIFLPDRSGPLDNDTIKNAVMTYGAVYTSMHWDDLAYNSSTYAYYYSSSGGNHAVGIVGWDDNYSQNNFASTPPGNGAFIIRNSWGSSWGQSGYFYISYYDSIVGSGNTLFLNAEPASNYSRVYYHDPFGCISHIGYNQTTCWAANVFTASATEPLVAAAFYTPALDCSYNLYVYTDPNVGAPQTGTLAASASGTISTVGYHTVSFASPPTVTSGHRFSIVLKLTSPDYNYPIAFETPLSGYCSAASANSGESYLSSDGSGWSDLTGFSGFEESNVCIQGVTAPETTPPRSALCRYRPVRPSMSPSASRWVPASPRLPTTSSPEPARAHLPPSPTASLS